MANDPIAGRSLPVWWMAWAMTAVIVRLLSTGVLEGGDGIQHFQIAHYAWKHPVLLLEHWGKPLFTLLASPFAQLGLWGMTLFNALCFMATCWAADGVLRKAGDLARWLFAPLLLLVPVYGSMVLGGMTEPLFALLATLAVRMLAEERFAVAMVIVSFMPYARPEHVAIAPFVVGYVLWQRKWRALPFLAVGHVFYGVAGWFALGDPLWVINRDPYGDASTIYGSGDALHFVDHLPESYGIQLLWLCGIAILAGGLLWWRSPEDRSTMRMLGIAALLPSVGILLVHSLLWWKGWKGSLGLLRVLATSAPLVVLCALWPLVRAGRLLIGRTRMQWALGLLLLWALPFHAVEAFLEQHPLPASSDAYERFFTEVGLRVSQIKDEYGRVASYHPHVAYAAGLDPYDPEETLQGMGGAADAAGLQNGDLLVWDAHFGPNEGGTPLDRLFADTSLQLLDVMVPEERMIVLGGAPLEAYLFTRGPGRALQAARYPLMSNDGISAQVQVRADTIPCDGAKRGDRCFTGSEFPLELAALPLDSPGVVFTEVVTRGDLTMEGGNTGEVNLVLTQETDAGKLGYWSQRLTGGPFEMRCTVPPRGADVRNKLYIWNLSGRSLRVESMKIELVQHLRAQ